MRITFGTPRSSFRYQTAAKVTTASPTVWSTISTVGFPARAAARRASAVRS